MWARWRLALICGGFGGGDGDRAACGGRCTARHDPATAVRGLVESVAPGRHVAARRQTGRLTAAILARTSYSTLTQITPANVSKLKVAFQLGTFDVRGGNSYRPENQPMVLTMGQTGVTNLPKKTTMFMETNWGLVALNPTSGSTLWQYKGVAKKGLSATGTQPAPGHRCAARRLRRRHDLRRPAGRLAGGRRREDRCAGLDGRHRGRRVEGRRRNVFGESNPWARCSTRRARRLEQPARVWARTSSSRPRTAAKARCGATSTRTTRRRARSSGGPGTTPDPTQLPFILTWREPGRGGNRRRRRPGRSRRSTTSSATSTSAPATPIRRPDRSPGKELWTDIGQGGQPETRGRSSGTSRRSITTSQRLRRLEPARADQPRHRWQARRGRRDRRQERLPVCAQRAGTAVPSPTTRSPRCRSRTSTAASVRR